MGQHGRIPFVGISFGVSHMALLGVASPLAGWGGAGRGGAGVQISLPVTAKRIRKLHRGTGKVNTLSRGSGTDRCAIIINDVH